MHHKFSDTQVEYIIKNAQRKFRDEIASHLGLIIKQVEYIARKNDIVLKPRPKGQYTRTYKYDFNHHYFDKIDTPNKAYVMGFIFADGNIHTKRNRYRLTIGLAIKDICILEFIKQELQGNFPIVKKTSKGHHSCQLTIDSKHMIQQLVRLGMKPRKTYLTALPRIPHKLRKYFFLGVFDGDGCISILTRQRGKYVCVDHKMTITAKHKKTLQNLLQYCGLSKYGKIIKTQQYHVWYVCNKKTIIEIYHRIYDNKCWCLSRKHDKFKELLT